MGQVAQKLTAPIATVGIIRGQTTVLKQMSALVELKIVVCPLLLRVPYYYDG